MTSVLDTAQQSKRERRCVKRHVSASALADSMSGPSSEPTGPVKATAVGSTRSRRKLLTTEEAELFELAQAAGTSIDPEVFKILLDLLRMNVAPTAVFQMLRSMCAGQRLAAEGAPEPARGRTKTGPTTTGPQTLSDHSSREGSSQRVPRQPSASRLQKTGKST